MLKHKMSWLFFQPGTDIVGARYEIKKSCGRSALLGPAMSGSNGKKTAHE